MGMTMMKLTDSSFPSTHNTRQRHIQRSYMTRSPCHKANRRSKQIYKTFLNSRNQNPYSHMKDMSHSTYHMANWMWTCSMFLYNRNENLDNQQSNTK